MPKVLLSSREVQVGPKRLLMDLLSNRPHKLQDKEHKIPEINVILDNLPAIQPFKIQVPIIILEQLGKQQLINILTKINKCKLK